MQELSENERSFLQSTPGNLGDMKEKCLCTKVPFGAQSLPQSEMFVHERGVLCTKLGGEGTLFIKVSFGAQSRGRKEAKLEEQRKKVAVGKKESCLQMYGE